MYIFIYLFVLNKTTFCKYFCFNCYNNYGVIIKLHDIKLDNKPFKNKQTNNYKKLK